jgi:hypothetical protein
MRKIYLETVAGLVAVAIVILGYPSVQMIVRAAGKKGVVECGMEGKTPDDLKWERVSWERFWSSARR